MLFNLAYENYLKNNLHSKLVLIYDVFNLVDRTCCAFNKSTAPFLAKVMARQVQLLEPGRKLTLRFYL